jgi:hypothetical protein
LFRNLGRRFSLSWTALKRITELRPLFLQVQDQFQDSPALKSTGTLELLIRWASGSRHSAAYGSPKKSSSDRMAGSEGAAGFVLSQ